MSDFSKRPILICDTECYRNYWLIKFYDPSLTGVSCFKFEIFENTKLDINGLLNVLSKYTIITFNGKKYDEPMITLALQGKSCLQLKEASDLLIKDNLSCWEFYKHFDLYKKDEIDHIDIMEVLKGVGVSLKKYGGRLHCPKIQELPVHESSTLTKEQIALIDHPYCTNDLTTTYACYLQCQSAVDLRIQMSEVYGIDLRSKSDAQMAEAIIKKQLNTNVKKSTLSIGSTFTYSAPSFIKFKEGSDLDTIVKHLEEVTFSIGENNEICIPLPIKNHIITIGNTSYKMGIGGLHSMEESVNYTSDDEFSIVDADVASYYPSLILICKMFPSQIGRVFLEIYKNIYDERLSAKKEGRKLISDCLKIVLNGIYGKFGSRYSLLYAPDLMLKVTLSGQLALLMLINSLEELGIRVISANTDGIVMRLKKSQKRTAHHIIKEWEHLTGLIMEYTKYDRLFSRDVNNYIAFKVDGTVKTKGVFSPMSVEKDPHNHIAIDAVIAYLTDGTPIEKTILASRDITKFVTVRYCKVGAVYITQKDLPEHACKEELCTVAGYYVDTSVKLKRWVTEKGLQTTGTAYTMAKTKLEIANISETVGKVVRFYIGNNQKGYLAHSTTKNKISDSYGAVLAMELPSDFPEDIDYDYYIKEAESHLEGLAITER